MWYNIWHHKSNHPALCRRHWATSPTEGRAPSAPSPLLWNPSSWTVNLLVHIWYHISHHTTTIHGAINDTIFAPGSCVLPVSYLVPLWPITVALSCCHNIWDVISRPFMAPGIIFKHCRTHFRCSKGGNVYSIVFSTRQTNPQNNCFGGSVGYHALCRQDASTRWILYCLDSD